MSSHQYRFEKVLTYRELQKTETEMEFKTSVDAFETVATELYNLLKTKESTLVNQEEKMQVGASIDEIHHYARYIDSLEKKIEYVQQQVIQARSKMNWFEDKLLERTLEVRKFEKMKEKDYDHYRAEEEYKEAQRLDELSTMTFRGRENG